LAWFIGICIDCCWLLVAGDWQTRLLKKSGAILTFNGLRSNSLHYHASCKLPIASGLLHKPLEAVCKIHPHNAS